MQRVAFRFGTSLRSSSCLELYDCQSLYNDQSFELPIREQKTSRKFVTIVAQHFKREVSQNVVPTETPAIDKEAATVYSSAIHQFSIAELPVSVTGQHAGWYGDLPCSAAAADLSLHLWQQGADNTAGPTAFI